MRNPLAIKDEGKEKRPELSGFQHGGLEEKVPPKLTTGTCMTER